MKRVPHNKYAHDIVETARVRYEAGEKVSAISRDMNVAEWTIYDWRRKYRWKRRTLTSAEKFPQIYHCYVSTAITLEALSEKYDVPYWTIVHWIRQGKLPRSHERPAKIR